MEAKRQSNNSYNKKILNIGPKKTELFSNIVYPAVLFKEKGEGHCSALPLQDKRL